MTRFKKVSIYFTLTLASVLLLLVTILAGNNNNYNNNNLSVDGEAYQLLLRQQDQTTTKPNEVIATGLEVVFDLEIKVIEKENTHKISKITFEISNTTTISTIMDVTNFNTVNSNGVSEDWKYKQGSTNKSLELYLE